MVPAFNAGGETFPLKSAFPIAASQSARLRLGHAFQRPSSWLSVSTAADRRVREVEGKAVMFHSIASREGAPSPRRARPGFPVSTRDPFLAARAHPYTLRRSYSPCPAVLAIPSERRTLSCVGAERYTSAMSCISDERAALIGRNVWALPSCHATLFMDCLRLACRWPVTLAVSPRS